MLTLRTREPNVTEGAIFVSSDTPTQCDIIERVILEGETADRIIRRYGERHASYLYSVPERERKKKEQFRISRRYARFRACYRCNARRTLALFRIITPTRLSSRLRDRNRSSAR